MIRRLIALGLGLGMILGPAVALADVVEVDGGQLYYESCGSGPQAIVLLHDGLVDASSFDDMWPILCGDFHVVRYDRRGYGKSPAATAPYSQTQDLAAVVAAAKVERFGGGDPERQARCGGRRRTCAAAGAAARDRRTHHRLCPRWPLSRPRRPPRTPFRLNTKENRMRSLIVAAALAAAGPAAADTLQEVTTHGIVLNVEGTNIDVTYTPDGKFTAAGVHSTGTWRIDGDKLCTTSNVRPEEACAVYPPGNKSGDSFEVSGPRGSGTVTINYTRSSVSAL